MSRNSSGTEGGQIGSVLFDVGAVFDLVVEQDLTVFGHPSHAGRSLAGDEMIDQLDPADLGTCFARNVPGALGYLASGRGSCGFTQC